MRKLLCRQAEKLDSRPHGYLQVPRPQLASAYLLTLPRYLCPALGAWLTLTLLTDHHLSETFPSPAPLVEMSPPTWTLTVPQYRVLLYHVLHFLSHLIH